MLVSESFFAIEKLCAHLIFDMCIHFAYLFTFSFSLRAKQSNRFNTLTDKRKSLQGKRQKNKDSNYHKQFPCKKFKRGECDRGEDCKYSHDVREVMEDASMSIDSSKT